MDVDLPVVARARATRTLVVSARRRRQVTVAAAHRTRRRSRALRLRTAAVRESALEHRWELWMSRMLTDAPTYVPLSWDLGPHDDESVLRATVRACEDVAVAARLVLAVDADQERRDVLVVTAALAEVAAVRMRSEQEDAWIAVAGTARLLEQLEEGFESGGVPDRAVLMVACRTALGTLRHALARFHEQVER